MPYILVVDLLENILESPILFLQDNVLGQDKLQKVGKECGNKYAKHLRHIKGKVLVFLARWREVT